MSRGRARAQPTGALLLAALLVACGGGPGAPAPADPTDPPAPAAPAAVHAEGATQKTDAIVIPA
ncbi:MAG: hypothetical protein RL071_268, partial [Pseudomonadota bacterium]